MKGGDDMAQLSNYKQKATAKMKQIDGKMMKSQGGMTGVKGGIRQVEGKAEEVMADAKIAFEKSKAKNAIT